MKTSKDLREFLIQQMGLVATGEQEPSSAKAICNYSQQIYNTLNLELKYAAMKAKSPEAGVDPVAF